MKCTQYEICGQATFKNARAMFFSKSAGAGNNFRSGLENLTVPEYSSPEKFVGGNLMSALVVSVRARCFVLVLGFSVSKCV